MRLLIAEFRKQGGNDMGTSQKLQSRVVFGFFQFVSKFGKAREDVRN
jgi:hypothetical protein